MHYTYTWVNKIKHRSVHQFITHKYFHNGIAPTHGIGSYNKVAWSIHKATTIIKNRCISMGCYQLHISTALAYDMKCPKDS